MADTSDSPGFVYFIRAGRTANIKIGWAMDAQRRLDQLQTGSPHKLHLIGYAPGGMLEERDWHFRWEGCRVRGEWFRLSNDLRTAINARLHLTDATRFISISTDWRALTGMSARELQQSVTKADVRAALEASHATHRRPA